MRTSLSDITKTEKYLQGQLGPEDSLLFQARLLVDGELRANTFFHRMVHRLVSLYRRKQLKEEVEAIHKKLFFDPAKADFRERVMKNFNF